MLKKPFRQLFRQRRNGLDRRSERSIALCNRLTDMSCYHTAQVIHCYLPIQTEVDTLPLIANALDSGKHVVVPVVRGESLVHTRLVSLHPDDMESDTWGIPCPRQIVAIEAGLWDLTIVPLLAFDRSGHRLGYGKGFYDRLLVACSSLPSIGFAFAIQEADALPHDSHDIPLDWIITENETIRTHSRQL
jgi:5-formyltetrahydrofolate cyclo-ligase